MNNYSYSQSSVFNDDGTYTAVGNRWHHCKPQQMLECCIQFMNVYSEHLVFFDSCEWKKTFMSLSIIETSLAITFKTIVDEVYPGFNKLNDIHGRNIIKLYSDAVQWIKDNSFIPTPEQVLFAWVREVMIPLIYSSEDWIIGGIKFNEKLIINTGYSPIKLSLVPDYMTGICSGETCFSPQQEVLFWHSSVGIYANEGQQMLKVSLQTITKFWLETLR